MRLHKAVCPTFEFLDGVKCNARVLENATIDNTITNTDPLVTSTPNGYGPTQFLSAYNLTPAAKNKTIIAIVDAYDDKNIKTDLDFYDSTFQLPSFPTCSGKVASSTTSCFQKVDQTGGTKYPSSNTGWALEESLDVETAHAICENCSILLVEAKSTTMTNLMDGVDEARALGANIISNSYGGSESSSETKNDTHFDYPGIAFTVSAGDEGYGAEYPAASRYVTAVGGTTLNLTSSNNYSSETAWSDGGSGCSKYETKPSFQTDKSCTKRTIADVSADADPNTGAAVYDSLGYEGEKGWFVLGGTSLSSPLVAGVYALGGLKNNVMENSLPYSNYSTSNFHDVISGSNGSCKGSYLCSAMKGYDGPTGLGSPKGSGGF